MHFFSARSASNTNTVPMDEKPRMWSLNFRSSVMEMLTSVLLVMARSEPERSHTSIALDECSV